MPCGGNLDRLPINLGINRGTWMGESKPGEGWGVITEWVSFGGNENIQELDRDYISARVDIPDATLNWNKNVVAVVFCIRN